MKAMVFTGTGKAARAVPRSRRPARATTRSSSAWPACGRVPDGPAHRRRGAHGAEAAAHPGAPDRRRGSSRRARTWTGFIAGDRVGVPWLGWTDGTCKFCRSDREKPLRPWRASPATQIDGRLRGIRRGGTHATASPIPPNLPRRRRGFRCSARVSSGTGRCASPDRASASGLYGLRRGPRTSSCRFAKHQGRAIYAFHAARRREGRAVSRARWARPGRAARSRSLPRSSTPRSSFAPRRPASCPPPLRAPRQGAAPSCAPAST